MDFLDVPTLEDSLFILFKRLLLFFLIKAKSPSEISSLSAKPPQISKTFLTFEHPNVAKVPG